MLEELLRSIIEHIMRRTLFYGLYRYRVIGQTNEDPTSRDRPADTVTLQAASKIDGLPDLVSVPKCHGLAGTTEFLAPSTLVLVAFEGGNPGAPFIAHYLPGQALPKIIHIDATAAIVLGISNAQPVALAAATNSNFTALLAAVNALNAVQTPPIAPIPILPKVDASKLFAE